MIEPIPATTNTRNLLVVARADGSPITAGTVNYYLVALTGDNAGKWFKHSDQTWNAAETICIAMTYKGGAWWQAASVHADGWIDGVEYVEYAKESGDLHVPVGQTFVCRYRISLTSAGKVAAATNDDKTGYSLATDQAVNVTKWNGTAVAVGGVSALPKVDAQAISDATAAADGVESNIGNLDAAISSRSSHAAANVWAVETRTLSSFGTLAADVATAVWAATTRSLTTFGSLAADTATAVWAGGSRTLTGFGTLVADIWATATSGLTTAGSVGKMLVDRIDQTLTALGAGIRGADNDTLETLSDQLDTSASAAAIADAVWDEATSGHATAGTAGKALTDLVPSSAVNLQISDHVITIT